MAVKQASYKILLNEGQFELRLYDPMVVVTCGEIDLAGGDGLIEYLAISVEIIENL